MRTTSTVLALCLLALIILMPTRSTAVDAPSQPRLLCRVFEVPLTGDTWDSADPNHPIGAWIQELDERGWALHTTQLTVGQKRTGYAQGYQQVCLRPR